MKNFNKISLSLITVLIMHKVLVHTKPMGEILDSLFFSQVFLDKNEKLLRIQLSKDESYRVFRPIDKISPLMIESTLIYEDKHYYSHFGFNPISLVRAFYQTYIKKERAIGASTVTMQLSRYLNKLNTRTILGKLKQIAYAVKLEFMYSKEDILEAYFNVVPYGFNIEGVEAASLIYFNKSSGRLTLEEAITLSVIPQNPNVRANGNKKNVFISDKLKKARQLLVKRWIKHHPENVDKYIGDNLSLNLQMRHPKQLPFEAKHFVMDLTQRNGRNFTGKNSSVVKTTIDLGVQKLFEKNIKDYITRNKKFGIKNAATLLVNTKTMEVVSSVGSADFFENSISGQVNGVTSRRSPGSALKPLVYALALEQGIIHPRTLMKDTKASFSTYSPDNFDKQFKGPMSAHHALIQSRNIPSIYLASKVKKPSLYEFLKYTDIPLNEDPEHYGLSIVLGTAEVTMEELVRLYALLNNGGRFRKLNKIYPLSYSKGEAMLTKESSFLVLDILKDNPRPQQLISDNWLLHKKSIAWKTGTSVSFKDAWAVGVFGDYALAVWVGNFSGAGNPVFIGRTASGPLLFKLFNALMIEKNLEAKPIYPTSDLNLTKTKVCALSGHLPGPNCVHKKTTWFIPGVSPISKCNIHRSIPIDIATGLRACPKVLTPVKNKVYEFWPSDILKLYRAAGIGRKLPPALHPLCKQTLFAGVKPNIISPKENIIYNLRTKGSGSKEIPLVAISDGDIRKLSWYLDDVYQGDVLSHKTMFWKASKGKHKVQVVDNQGRMDETEFEVRWND